MREVMEALYTFWSQFGVPAYAEDVVPPTAKVPYIRYTVPRGPLMGSSVMVAHNYHSAKLMGNVERAELSGRIAKAIPQGGAKIPVEGLGYLILRRGSDFQTLYQDPDDRNIIGIRTSVEVDFYIL